MGDYAAVVLQRGQFESVWGLQITGRVAPYPLSSKGTREVLYRNDGERVHGALVGMATEPIR